MGRGLPFPVGAFPSKKIPTTAEVVFNKQESHASRTVEVGNSQYKKSKIKKPKQ